LAVIFVKKKEGQRVRKWNISKKGPGAV